MFQALKALILRNAVRKFYHVARLRAESRALTEMLIYSWTEHLAAILAEGYAIVKRI